MIGLCLVDGINDQYKITKYPLLSKMSEKKCCLNTIALGFDVLPKPRIDGIGTKTLNGIVETVEFLK